MRMLIVFLFIVTHIWWPHATTTAAPAPAPPPPASLPIGSIILFAGDIVPEGWLLCNGQNVSRMTYFPLFYVIGTLYGSGDHIRTFNLPDFRGRFPLGLQQEQRSGVAQGGVDHVTLTTAHLPSHVHSSGSLNARSDGGHSHLYDDPGHDHGGQTGLSSYSKGTWPMAGLKGGNGNDHNVHSHTINKDYTRITIQSGGAHSHIVEGQTGPEGAGQAFSVMPPYQTINYIIYAGPDFSANIG
ncbi:unnamed protein product [Adineta steineri]|uniref:Phage tail collar domain-containing protein n=1 Tax=Adineta steineri TaxID=433720 RepID=A0A819RFW5_9BILA|nr:unnamed protein product [Adineta steineri]CAF4046457.1 unnamed protein product [Adineta steineri]